MDFGGILTRAWQITWRWKVLWVLGFLVGLTGWSSGFGNSGWRFSGNQFPGNRLPNFNVPPALTGLIVGLGCLAVIVGIVLWVISIMARGGLIAGVSQVEEQGSTSLGSAWAVGQARFWTLFGIGVLVTLPIIILVVIAVLGVIATLVPWFSVTSSAAGQGTPGNALAAVLIACVCGYICGLVLVAIVLEQIRIYAERAAILEGLNWTAAFSRGWRVLRDNIGPTLILWLIFLVLGLAFGVLTLIVLLPVLVPLFAIIGQNQASGAWWLVLCGGGLLALVVGAIVNSIVQAFTSATWTLTYRSLTGHAGRPPAAVERPVEG